MLRDDDPPDRQIAKLTRINAVLIDRIDRLEESRGFAWSMFQAAVALEQEVLARTRDLERAMTDLSQRNRELAVARASAEEANRSKTRFLRAASHDLLQPLSAARLFLSALTDTPMDDHQTELTDRLGSAFESVEQLMHAVLDISRLDSQRIEFNRQPVPLDDLFRRLAAEFAPVAQAKGLRLRFMPTTRIGGQAIPIFLRRIAQNLVSNAIKYTHRGGVAVGARRTGGGAGYRSYDDRDGHSGRRPQPHLRRVPAPDPRRARRRHGAGPVHRAPGLRQAGPSDQPVVRGDARHGVPRRPAPGAGAVGHAAPRRRAAARAARPRGPGGRERPRDAPRLSDDPARPAWHGAPHRAATRPRRWPRWGTNPPT